MKIEGDKVESKCIGWPEQGSLPPALFQLCYGNFHHSKQLACKKPKSGYISQCIVKISYFDSMPADKTQEATF